MGEATTGPIRRLPIWAVVAGGMALAVGLAVSAIIGISGSLPSDVLVSLKPVVRDTGGLDWIHIDEPPTGVARGMQLGLLGLLLGGVPAAVLSAILARWGRSGNKKWSEEWGNAFLAGFVFQLSSFVVTAFLIALVCWAAFDSAADVRRELFTFAAPLLLSVSCSIWGLRSWRSLQLEVQHTPVTIATHRAPPNKPLQPTSGGQVDVE